jgi:tellurite resistance-related uncharacterized protein
MRKLIWPIQSDASKITAPSQSEWRRPELPSGLELYARTPDFTHLTIPAELTTDHALAEGAWAVLRVLDGTVLFHDAGASAVETVPAGGFRIIAPELPHRLQTPGPACFFIEFHIWSDKIRATIPSGSC